MARYRIWCRTAEITPGQFMATVCAIPETEQDGIGALSSESRLLGNEALAHRECEQMAREMRQRVIAQGHEVTGVDLV